MKTNKFEIFWKYLGWHCFSIGFHIDWSAPHIELHLLCGFMRIGWRSHHKYPDNYTWTTGLTKII